MSKFNASTPLETVLRIFPAFPRILSAATEDQLVPLLEKALERPPHATTIEEFCKQTLGNLNLNLETVLDEANRGYFAWLEIEIRPGKLAELMESDPDKLMLIDVRETWEHALVSLPFSLRMQDFKSEDLIAAASRKPNVILYCHHGVRSLYAAAFLREQGVPHALSLQGGIDAYALAHAPNMPRY
jgi:rhodanese-related sulfurtransferase